MKSYHYFHNSLIYLKTLSVFPRADSRVLSLEVRVFLPRAVPSVTAEARMRDSSCSVTSHLFESSYLFS